MYQKLDSKARLHVVLMSACNKSLAVIAGEIGAFYNCDNRNVSEEVSDLIKDNKTDIMLLRELLRDSEVMLNKFWDEDDYPRFSTDGSYVVPDAKKEVPGGTVLDQDTSMAVGGVHTLDLPTLEDQDDTLPVDFIEVRGKKKTVQFMPGADVPTEVLFLLLKAMSGDSDG